MASISIPILDEMVDEVRYEVILLWTAIFNTMISEKRKEKKRRHNQSKFN